MSGHKRSLPAAGTPPSSSNKRRKPSTQVVDLTADSDDDDHDHQHHQPAPSSSSAWVFPWSVYVNAGIETFKALVAAAGPGPSSSLVVRRRRAG